MKKLLILMTVLCLTSTAYSKEPQLYDDDYDITKMTVKEYYGISRMNLIEEYAGDTKKMLGYLHNTERVKEYMDGLISACITFLPYDKEQMTCMITKTIPLINYEDDSISDKPIIEYVRHKIVDCFSEEYKKMWKDSFPKDKK